MNKVYTQDEIDDIAYNAQFALMYHIMTIFALVVCINKIDSAQYSMAIFTGILCLASAAIGGYYHEQAKKLTLNGTDASDQTPDDTN